MNRKISKIVRHDLCLGCGICEALAGSENCKMVQNDIGFYEPQFNTTIPKDLQDNISFCCPGIHVNSNSSRGVWGNVLHLTESWSADPTIRKKGSSGGTITALCVHLLKTKKVNAVLHVGLEDNSYILNTLKVSRTINECISNAASRYAPALMFDKIFKILDSSEESFAFVGKPCDIAGIKNILIKYPKYRNRFKYFIALFCAGMPSYGATKKVLKLSERNDEPISLKYRGDGWPGFFEAKYSDGESFKMSYNDSWGKILGRNLGFRCKICPDGIGLLADIAIGDSWNTKDGYPDFTESDGRSFVMARTPIGLSLIKDAKIDGDIESNDLDISKVDKMQPYQYKRRIYSAYKILSVQIASQFLLKFKGIGVKRLIIKANFFTGCRILLGTVRRLIRK